MKKNIVVKIGKNNVANDLPLTLIAGPCLIESKEHAVDMAGKINEICSLLNINFIFKSITAKAFTEPLKYATNFMIFCFKFITKYAHFIVLQ